MTDRVCHLRRPVPDDGNEIVRIGHIDRGPRRPVQAVERRTIAVSGLLGGTPSEFESSPIHSRNRERSGWIGGNRILPPHGRHDRGSLVPSPCPERIFDALVPEKAIPMKAERARRIDQLRRLIRTILLVSTNP